MENKKASHFQRQPNNLKLDLCGNDIILNYFSHVWIFRQFKTIFK